ncbi:MAG: hypothetical protein PHC34_13850 [Candidatus Gastranaerophilales bacterium]|nr:hypothetical protein [Candidatus Gastranaerophilales bacterium]
MREKSAKLKNKLMNFGPKLKWFLFTELQDFKLTSKYIDFLCPGLNKTNTNSLEKLEGIVKQSIIKEFSPEIQNTKSFNLLVDAVMYKIQKKSFENDPKSTIS